VEILSSRLSKTRQVTVVSPRQSIMIPSPIVGDPASSEPPKKKKVSWIFFFFFCFFFLLFFFFFF